jgi:RNA polymerase sigma-B factor
MRASVGTGYDGVVCLIEAYRERGDQASIERIFAMHGRLLNHIVRRHAASSGETYEDLLQVGYVGLIKAVNGYRVDSDAKFDSYAYAMIEGEVRHHLRDAGLVKKPRWARSLYARISEATSRLTAELGRPPLVDEVAREVNVSEKGVLELMKLYLDTNVSSLDEGEEGVDVSAIRSLHHESFSLPIEDRIQLEEAFESLTELQRKVIYLFFYKDLSQTEIGRTLGLPQRKISRVVASGIKTMKDSQDAEGKGLG